jgi:hypothetical protein
MFTLGLLLHPIVGGSQSLAYCRRLGLSGRVGAEGEMVGVGAVPLRAPAVRRHA